MFISGAKPASGMMEKMQQDRADARETARSRKKGDRRMGEGGEEQLFCCCASRLMVK